RRRRDALYHDPSVRPNGDVRAAGQPQDEDAGVPPGRVVSLMDANNLGALAGDLQKLARQLINQRMLNRLGLASIRIVKTRTRRGIDVEGQPFRAYSDDYAALKR